MKLLTKFLDENNKPLNVDSPIVNVYDGEDLIHSGSLKKGKKGVYSTEVNLPEGDYIIEYSGVYEGEVLSGSESKTVLKNLDLSPIEKKVFEVQNETSKYFSEVKKNVDDVKREVEKSNQAENIRKVQELVESKTQGLTEQISESNLTDRKSVV